MATPTTTAPAPSFKKRLEPYLVPYYLTLVSVLGGITVVFIALTLAIVLVATNFNILSLIE